ncbi:hypothetical protein [Bartonella choladocola]|uniref:hypothetical protein n=1 Tax=Bartonella choladocola TaxID=2750995 RepID=UPI003B520340
MLLHQASLNIAFCLRLVDAKTSHKKTISQIPELLLFLSQINEIFDIYFPENWFPAKVEEKEGKNKSSTAEKRRDQKNSYNDSLMHFYQSGNNLLGSGRSSCSENSGSPKMAPD